MDKHAEWIARLECIVAGVHLACLQFRAKFADRVNPHYCQTERTASEYAHAMSELHTLLTELKAKTRQQEGHIAWLNKQVRLKVPIKTREEMYRESEESIQRATFWTTVLLFLAGGFFVLSELLKRT